MANRVDFKIHHVQNNIMAFSIDFDFFFLSLNQIPILFDANLERIIVSNFDTWFSAKTKQRYSYQTVCDMMGAYADALKHTYGLDDLKKAATHAALHARHHIIVNAMCDYSKSFWIETTKPEKIIEKIIPEIRENFDTLLNKLGKEKFINYLNRLHTMAHEQCPTIVPVLEKFIERMGTTPSPPEYPSTIEQDNKLIMAVLNAIFPKEQPTHHKVDELISSKLYHLSRLINS